MVGTQDWRNGIPGAEAREGSPAEAIAAPVEARWRHSGARLAHTTAGAVIVGRAPRERRTACGEPAHR